jgi:hypothetical protein
MLIMAVGIITFIPVNTCCSRRYPSRAAARKQARKKARRRSENDVLND